MNELNIQKPDIDWAAWVLAARTEAGLSQEDFAASIGTSKTVISRAESNSQPASTELIALITYARQRGDPIGSIEKVWSRAAGKPVKVARPNANWVYELLPYAEGVPDDDSHLSAAKAAFMAVMRTRKPAAAA